MSEKSKKNRPGGFNRGLAKWLTENDVLMGERSNFASLAAAIQKGGNQGCSGTKGCGKVRIEPFEEWESLEKLHATFGDAGRYATSFRALTNWERWVLCALYLVRKETLPLGLHSALGDMAGVALLVSHRMGLLDQFLEGHGPESFARWQGIAEVVSEDAHARLEEALADYDSDQDAVGSV